METILLSVEEQFSLGSQADFVQRVEIFSDQFEKGHPGFGLSEDFTWKYTPNFSLNRLAGRASEWICWSAEEKALWIEDWAPCQKDHFEKWWLPQPWLYPVITVEGTDGLFDLWDGNHRIGVAFTAGLKTIPAIVGIRNRQILQCPRNKARARRMNIPS